MIKTISKLLIAGALFSGFLFSCNNHAKPNKKKELTGNADSLEILTKKIIADSNNYKLYLKRAQLYLKKNRVDPCLRDLTKTLSFNVKDPEIYYTLSDTYFILGKIQESIDALKKAVDINPQRQESYIKLARLYLILKEYNQATRLSDRAISLNPDNPRPFFIKAMINIEQGDTASSVQNLRLALNLDKKYFEANMQLGTILSMQKDSSSIYYFKNALKQKPGNYAAYYGLAMAFQNSGNSDSALSVYDTILKYFPDNTQALFNKGYIYLVEKGSYKDAENCFKKVIELDSTYVEAVYNLGRTYEAENNIDKAEYFYRKALKLVPNYPLAIRGLSRIDR
jgi:tetratricopeptide (TPR) repeat protein